MILQFLLVGLTLFTSTQAFEGDSIRSTQKSSGWQMIQQAVKVFPKRLPSSLDQGAISSCFSCIPSKERAREAFDEPFSSEEGSIRDQTPRSSTFTFNESGVSKKHSNLSDSDRGKQTLGYLFSQGQPSEFPFMHGVSRRDSNVSDADGYMTPGSLLSPYSEPSKFHPGLLSRAPSDLYPGRLSREPSELYSERIARDPSNLSLERLDAESSYSYLVGKELKASTREINIKKHKDEAVLLYEDEDIMSILFNNHQKPPERRNERHSEHASFLKYIQETLPILRNLKLLEIGKIDEPSFDWKILNSLLPKNIAVLLIQKWQQSSNQEDISLISKETSSELGHLLLYQIMKRIVNYTYKLDPLTDYSDHLICLKSKFMAYSFKTIDYLWKNGFIEQACLQQVFQEDRVSQWASVCTRNYYSETLGLGSWIPQRFLNQQWYWPIGFQFYEALSREDILRITLELMEQNFEFMMPEIKWNGDPLPGAWKNFSSSAPCIAYITHLKSGQEAILMNEFNGSKREQLKDDMEMLINLLIEIKGPNSKYKEAPFVEDLSRNICEFFDLIEKNFCPGIIYETAQERVSNPAIILDYYQLLLTAARIRELRDIPKNYIALDENYIKILHSYSVDWESIDKFYKDEIKFLYPQFKERFQSIRQGGQKDWKRWLKNQNDLVSIYKDGLGLVEKTKFILNTNIKSKKITQIAKNGLVIF